jgi:antitoxin VapB
MALNIKDSEAEQLAAEVARLSGESKTGAVRTALRERRARLLAQASGAQRRELLERRLRELWSEIPADLLGGPPLSKAERESILGLGRDGV